MPKRKHKGKKKRNIEKNEDNKRIIGPQKDISDFCTEPKQYAWNVVIVLFSCVENTIIAFLQFITCIILIPAGIFLYLFQGPLKFLGNRLQKYENIKPEESAVNIGTPNLLKNYRPPFNKLDKLFLTTQSLDGVGDIDMAIFFNLLSAVVYDSNECHDKVLQNWGFDPKMCIRVLYPTSCSATVIGYPVNNGNNNKLVLFIVFKGTSPLNLNEWLSDFNLVKIREIPELCNRYNIELPQGSELHGGFYRAMVNQVKNYKPNHAFDGIMQACNDVINIFAEQNKNKFDISKDVKVFLTGHSLGAGLCTIFTILLACANPTQENDDEKCNRMICDDEKCDHLKCDPANVETISIISNGMQSIYTYGNPNVCNAKLSKDVNNKLINKKIPFRSFRNGNDIVSVVPVGAQVMDDAFRGISWFTKNVVRVSGDQMGAISKVGDYYKIGTEYRISYGGNIRKVRQESGVIGGFVDIGIDCIVTLVNSIKSYGICVLTILKVVLNIFRTKPSDIDPIEEVVKYPTITATIGLVAMPSFLNDHVPSEYVKHLYKYKKKTIKKMT